MKPSIKSVVLASSLLALSALGVAQARSWDEIKKSGTIKMITEGAFAPFNFMEGDKVAGFEVDVANAVAKEMGVKVEWKAVPFDAEIPAIQQSRFDMAIASHGFTEERAKAVDFGEPHYCTGGIIATHKNGPLTANDLKGKVVAVQLATSYYDNVKKIAGIKEVKTYKADPEAFAALKAKRVQAWVSDRFLVKETLKKNGDAAIVTGELLFSERVSMISQKGNTSLLEAWNKGLKAIKANGQYAALSNKYFGEDVSCK